MHSNPPRQSSSLSHEQRSVSGSHSPDAHGLSIEHGIPKEKSAHVVLLEQSANPWQIREQMDDSPVAVGRGAQTPPSHSNGDVHGLPSGRSPEVAQIPKAQSPSVPHSFPPFVHGVVHQPGSPGSPKQIPEPQSRASQQSSPMLLSPSFTQRPQSLVPGGQFSERADLHAMLSGHPSPRSREQNWVQ